MKKKFTALLAALLLALSLLPAQALAAPEPETVDPPAVTETEDPEAPEEPGEPETPEEPAAPKRRTPPPHPPEDPDKDGDEH